MENEKLTKKAKDAIASNTSLQKLELYFQEKRGADAGTPSLGDYVFQILDFCEFLKKAPDQIINEAKEGKLVLYDPETRQGALEDYKLALLSRKPSNASLRAMFTPIKTWLKVNGVKVDYSNFTLPKTKIREKDELPSEEQLRLIMEKATLRMKTAIAILASSGIRVGALLGLKLKDITLDYDASTGISKIVVPEELSKNGFSYTTFMSSEATKLLKQYLEYRKKKLGETITPESYVIVGQGKNRISRAAFRVAWARLLRKCGLAKKSYKYHVYHIHVLRKWFRSKTDRVLSSSVRERLMGHKGAYLDESYFRIPEEQLFNEYKKAHAFLLIQEGIEATLEEIEKDTEKRDAAIDILVTKKLREKGYSEAKIKAKIKEVHEILKRDPEAAGELLLSIAGKES
jgi:integrase